MIQKQGGMVAGSPGTTKDAWDYHGAAIAAGAQEEALRKSATYMESKSPGPK